MAYMAAIAVTVRGALPQLEIPILHHFPFHFPFSFPFDSPLSQYYPNILHLYNPRRKRQRALAGLAPDADPDEILQENALAAFDQEHIIF